MSTLSAVVPSAPLLARGRDELATARAGLPGPVAVGPSASFALRVETQLPPDEELARRIDSGKVPMTTQGAIEYVDGFGKRRALEFCLLRKPSDASWVQCRAHTKTRELEPAPHEVSRTERGAS